MANVINATSTGNGGLVSTGDDSGILNIQTNETTAITVDASQRVAFVAGTAALPAITTAGDTNTGIYFPAADTIAFSEGGTESMRIDSSGYVTKPNQPSFWVARNNGTAATGTDIIYNDVKFNVGSGYNSSNGRFTAPVTGYYFITATGINQGTTNVLFELLIMLNGTNVASARGYHNALGTVGGCTVTQVINLTAGDYVTIRPDVTTMYGSESRTAFFCGYLLG